jgi:hypothetical protein
MYDFSRCSSTDSENMREKKSKNLFVAHLFSATVVPKFISLVYFSPNSK